MAPIKAGCILKNKFVTPGSKAFGNYLNYIERESATKPETEFSAYQDYMDNPEKGASLFTKDFDNLTPEQRAQLKKVFQTAQDNGSVMWQTVFSFDNRWLQQNGLYDPETGILQQEKMQEYIRAAMGKLLEKEGIGQTAVWSASIHYNTDNIHVHVATVEPIPTRQAVSKENGQKEYRGKMRLSSLMAAKSALINRILSQQPENIKITDLIRNQIVKGKAANPLLKDKELAEKLLALYQKLPENRQLWNYNSNALHDVKPLIDSISKEYIEKYHPDEWKELQELLQKQKENYKTAYGNPKNGNQYAENKIQDLYTRMGNSILKELKAFDKEQRAAFSKEHPSRSQNTATWEKSYQNHLAKKYYRDSSTARMLNSMKKALKSDLENAKNQRAYEKLQEEQREGNSKNSGYSFDY